MGENTNRFVHNIMGQGRLNQLGGVYINGRPLPYDIRIKIIEMSKSNIKPCEISRKLRISHGAVSKILNRFAETGSITPGQIGGNPRHRLSIQSVEKQIALMKEERPEIAAQEIQQCLVNHGFCNRINVPTVSSINRHLKSRGLIMKKASKPVPLNQPIPNTSPWINQAFKEESPPSNQKLKFSVDNILNMIGQKNNDQRQVSSDGSESDASTPVSRSRTYFTPEQVDLLEKAYELNPYPDQSEKEKIAVKTGLNESKVQIWFSNRRARQRKNLTNANIYEYQLRSTAMQQQSPVMPSAVNPTILQQMNSNMMPRPVVHHLENRQSTCQQPASSYSLFAQYPVSLWNYIHQQPQFMQVIAAFHHQQQQKQQAGFVP